ncbi:MAG: riboflavin synthase [Lachnospiraceae bacterium]|nr:riboflavin synthase [Lachnospiraceae bacterium]
MFTGIIEELGTIRDLRTAGSSGQIMIGAGKVLEGTEIGDSIAVNGVCLTVTQISSDGFTADVMPETMRRTSLSIVGRGDKVNLERAMAVDGRFGGHIVSGHIDGTGQIRDFKKEGNAVWVTITAGCDILKFIVEKGSIAIDGISLTVAEVTDSYFRVSVIPHTGSETTLLLKHVGDPVNLETDIVGKYVAKLLEVKTEIPSDNTGSAGITMDMLREFLT